jgi:integrase
MTKRPNLSKRSVDTLIPGDAPFDVFDGTLKGFHVRVHPSGAKVYRLKYSVGGKQRAIAIGEHGAPWTPDTARTRAEVLRGAVKGGGDPIAERAAKAAAAAEAERRTLSVTDLIERWLSEGRAAAPNKRQSSWMHDASRLRRHIVPLLGDIPASGLKRADIEKAQQDIANGRTAKDERTGKRGRAIVRGGRAVARGASVSLSSCLSWAVAQELLEDNPVAKVKKFAPLKRERFLSGEEATRLLETMRAMEADYTLSSTHADCIRLLMLTGARRREISNLAWAEVDLRRGHIKLPPSRSKTGERIIPLNSHAAAILDARPRQGVYVFPSSRAPEIPAQDLQKPWNRVRVQAGLADLRLHDLRHSFASFAVADGASLSLIGKALGHSQISTTERYAHLGEDPVKQLAEKVGARIIGAFLDAGDV